MGTSKRGSYQATVTVAAAALLNGIAAFGFNLVATRQMDAELYASISVLWVLQYLWIAIGVTAIEAYTTRTVVLADGGRTHLTTFVRGLTVGLTVIAAVTAIVSYLLRNQLYGGAALFAPITAALVLSYGLYGVVRGEAAGRQRFRLYAVITAGESVLRLIFAVIFFAVASRPELVYLVFPLGPALMLLVAFTPKTRKRSNTDTPFIREPASPFFFSAVSANTAVQLLIASGPLFLVVLGATPAAVAVFFTTQTASRLPLGIAINGGLSRLLPPLIKTVQRGDARTFRRHAITIAGAVVVTTLAAILGGLFIGPALLEFLFGGTFRPTPAFTAAIFAGAVLTFGGLFVNQLYIALGQERRLAPVWWVCLIAAVVASAALPGDIGLRVAVSFSVATLAATVWLLRPLIRRGTTLPF